MAAYHKIAPLGVVGALMFAHWYWNRKPVRVPAETVHPPFGTAGLDGVPGIDLLTKLYSVVINPVGLVERNARKHRNMFTLRVPAIYDFTFLLDDESYAMVMSLSADHAAIGPVLSRVPTVGYWFPRSGRSPESLQRLIIEGRRFDGDDDVATESPGPSR
jgi:hypothetical protein